MASHSHLFRSRQELESRGLTLCGNIFEGLGETYLPLYEAKMTNQFDHRHGSIIGSDDLARMSGIAAQSTTLAQHQDPNFVALPRYWVAKPDVDAVLDQLDLDFHFLVVFRDVARATDVRTAVCSVVPVTAVGHKAPLILPKSGNAKEACAFLGSLNSYTCDYLVRQKFGSASLSFFVVKQTPCPSPDVYRSDSCGFSVAWFVTRVLELTYTAWDLEAFSTDCGYDGPPLRWDEERRFLLRCELDAAYFHLYLGSPAEWGSDSPELREMFPTPRDAVDYIMETFPIVKRRDIKRTEVKDAQGQVTTEGTYITKDTILSIYDEMQRAIDTGEPYQTRLDPPPGPPTDAEGNFIPMDQWDEANWPVHVHQPRPVTENAQ